MNADVRRFLRYKTVMALYPIPVAISRRKILRDCPMLKGYLQHSHECPFILRAAGQYGPFAPDAQHNTLSPVCKGCSLAFHAAAGVWKRSIVSTVVATSDRSFVLGLMI